MNTRQLASSLLLGVLLHAPMLAQAQSPTFLRQWGTFGSGAGQFQNPMGLTIDGSGNLLVADWFNCRVQSFTTTGVFTGAWGAYGNAPGEFSGPIGIATDLSGNIFVADASSRSPLVNNRVQVFSPGRTFLSGWGPPGIWGVPPGNAPGQFDSPEGIAVDAAGRVYVSDTFNGRIQVFSSAGVFIAQWGGAAAGGLMRPRGLALDGAGRLFVADDEAQCVHVYSSEGVHLGQVGGPGSALGQLMYPFGVAVRDGKLYVADAGNHRIQVFSTSGGFLTAWGAFGTHPGEFNNPCGVFVDDLGEVFVADQGNHRVQVFGSLPTAARPKTWGQVKALFR